jgi:hypothetical protein
MNEPSASFNDAALKIQWSQILIENLKRECASFIQLKPYQISVEANAEHGGYLFKVGLTREIPPPVRLLMGDICSNLRASLDYAWMGLIRKVNPGQTEKKTLPVADNRKGLISAIDKIPVKIPIKETQDLLADRIKFHSDFGDGGNKPLIALNRLCNWNKHNLLIATAGVTYVPLVRGPGFVMPHLHVYGGVGAVLNFSSNPGDLTYEGEPTVEILFGKHDFVQHEPVLPTLINLAQEPVAQSKISSTSINI